MTRLRTVDVSIGEYSHYEVEAFIEKDRLAISTVLVEALEGEKLGGHRDEDKRIYAGGFDDALTEAQNIIKKLLESKN